MSSAPVLVAFVCVQNAGRSQLAAAFAERERRARGLEQAVDVRTGGTQPADRVHDVVVDVLAERGIELGGRAPRAITAAELEAADVVVTMGCSAGAVCPASWSGESRDWDLADPAGTTLEEAREIRDEIDHRVRALFDDIERVVAQRV